MSMSTEGDLPVPPKVPNDEGGCSEEMVDRIRKSLPDEPICKGNVRVSLKAGNDCGIGPVIMFYKSVDRLAKEKEWRIHIPFPDFLLFCRLLAHHPPTEEFKLDGQSYNGRRYRYVVRFGMFGAVEIFQFPVGSGKAAALKDALSRRMVEKITLSPAHWLTVHTILCLVAGQLTE